MVRQWQELFHSERFSETHLTVDLPDYVKLAEAFGVAGFRCETRRRSTTRSAPRSTAAARR